MREHWGNCINHFDSAAYEFIKAYFGQAGRKCFLLAAAGFDPRSTIIAETLAKYLQGDLTALFIREERGDTNDSLRDIADANEAELSKVVTNSKVVPIAIFDSTDSAPVAGNRLVNALAEIKLPEGTTDIVLDMSALSMGIAFPAAKFLIELAEKTDGLNFHLMIASNPELDASIIGEPGEKVQTVRGFSGNAGREPNLPVARIWLPQLAREARGAIGRIKASLSDVYKVCPILPFPARDPRRGDHLIEVFGEEISGEWAVDSRDFMYVSESNPLDSYRSIETLKRRYDKTVEGVYSPQLILSPVGSKVMAAGAMMAALKYNLTVQYVETLRYEVNKAQDVAKMDIVHVWLHGPIYNGYKHLAT